MTRAAIASAAVDRLAPRVPDASMFEPVRCYACGSDDSSAFIEAVDDLTGRPGRFTFVRCSACDLVYQSPRLTLEHIKSYYDSGYIAHQKRNRWGPLSPLFNAAMDSLDRAKLRIVERYVRLDQASAVLDVGCATGSFLAKVRDQRGSAVVGVDFVDLSDRPTLRGAEFHHGLFYDQEVGRNRFDLVTMWHFLEHDYDPLRSLAHAHDALKPEGRLVVEVPRLDSLTYRMFKDRWPGLQAPQHTVLYDRRALISVMERSGYVVMDYLPYGAFPPYFYLFCGVAFRVLKGRGLNLDKAIYLYFAGQLAVLPVLPFLNRLNFAMQTIVCRRA